MRQIDLTLWLSRAHALWIWSNAPHDDATEELPDEIEALKQIIADLARDAVVAQAEIAKLKFQLARYRRAEFGRSSEKLAPRLAQLELAIEAVETDQAERLAESPPAVAAVIEAAVEAQKPARRLLPEHLPREEVVHPAPCTCPNCGGALRKIGEDVTETLDYVPGRFKVIRPYARETRLPDLRYGDPGAGAVSPDCPRSRRCRIVGPYRRLEVRRPSTALSPGRDLRARGRRAETSTLSGWVGAMTAALAPLTEVLTAERDGLGDLYGDDTPVPVLAPGSGKTKTGRIWTYVRDERPCGGMRPPAALFCYSSDRKGEHPRGHLELFTGVLHADGYAGFNGLFETGRPSSRRPAGRMSAASSSMSMQRPPRRSPKPDLCSRADDQRIIRRPATATASA